MEELNHIQVFGTNILEELDKVRVSAILSAEPKIEDWHLAMDDCDRVLRVVSRHMNAGEIIALINQCGYECRELD